MGILLSFGLFFKLAWLFCCSKNFWRQNSRGGVRSCHTLPKISYPSPLVHILLPMLLQGRARPQNFLTPRPNRSSYFKRMSFGLWLCGVWGSHVSSLWYQKFPTDNFKQPDLPRYPHRRGWTVFVTVNNPVPTILSQLFSSASVLVRITVLTFSSYLWNGFRNLHIFLSILVIGTYWAQTVGGC